MKFYHYINENIKELEDDDMDFLIERDCQPWVKASAGETVYRGAKSKPYNYKGTVRTNRKPVDTKPEVQELFDNIIQAKYGFKPRSNGLFITGNLSDARRYGRVYKIYPINKFKFLWSPTIRDFYSETRSIERKFIQDNINTKDDIEKYSKIIGKRFSREATISLPEVQASIKELVLNKYITKDLPRAINSYKEIMVVTKEFYAVIAAG